MSFKISFLKFRKTVEAFQKGTHVEFYDPKRSQKSHDTVTYKKNVIDRVCMN